jgi:hypothetical protein
MSLPQSPNNKWGEKGWNQTWRVSVYAQVVCPGGSIFRMTTSPIKPLGALHGFVIPASYGRVSHEEMPRSSRFQRGL